MLLQKDMNIMIYRRLHLYIILCCINCLPLLVNDESFSIHLCTADLFYQRGQKHFRGSIRIVTPSTNHAKSVDLIFLPHYYNSNSYFKPLCLLFLLRGKFTRTRTLHFSKFTPTEQPQFFSSPKQVSSPWFLM